jgi:hypothetical protein
VMTMRTRRLGRALSLAIFLGLAAGIALGCAAPERSRPSATPRTQPDLPSTSPSRPTTPAPSTPAATDNGALAGTWVADDGDVLDFVRTDPGIYRGAVLYASHCPPAAGPVVVSSQGAGRFTGTGPFASNGSGWCGTLRTSVAIQIGPSSSSAHVNSRPVGGVQTWARATFAIHGAIPLPGPNDEDQAEGSPALAQACDPATFERYELQGSLIATSFRLVAAPTAAGLLLHFLDGSGTATNFPATSVVAAEAVRSAAFQQEHRRVQGYIANRLAAGATSIDFRQASGVLSPVDFTAPALSDLYLSFRSTQGLVVSGAGAVVGSEYVGELTYVIEDAYGFGLHDDLLKPGAEMRYLQTTCGAPFHPGGAHWFPDSITVTVALRLPRMAGS